jgi:hypothetical protein
MAIEEKRKYTRLDTLNLLHFSLFDDQGVARQQGMGRTLNVSEAGILLESHTPLSEGSELRFAIGLEEELAEFRGHVVHREERDSGVFEYGIAFDTPNPAELTVLRAYIAAFMKRRRNGLL